MMALGCEAGPPPPPSPTHCALWAAAGCPRLGRRQPGRQRGLGGGGAGSQARAQPACLRGRERRGGARDWRGAGGGGGGGWGGGRRRGGPSGAGRLGAVWANAWPALPGGASSLPHLPLLLPRAPLQEPAAQQPAKQPRFRAEAALPAGGQAAPWAGCCAPHHCAAGQPPPPPSSPPSAVLHVPAALLPPPPCRRVV